MSFQSPLARAKGLGSAKEGVAHWWMQRITAIALLPLVLWCVFALARLPDLEYQTVYNWLSSPVSTIALIAMAIVLYYHSSLGVQVVVEDYIHAEWLKISTLVLVNLLNGLLAIMTIFFLLKIAFGS